MHRPMTPRPVQHGVGVELGCAPVDPKRASVLHARADCGGRVFTAKLAAVVHNLAHQLLNHLLADDAVLLARQFCDCLRHRVDHFIGFIGINFVGRGPCRIFGEEIAPPNDPPACPTWGGGRIGLCSSRPEARVSASR